MATSNDELAATHFLRVALDEAERAGVGVPLRVSPRAELARMGAAGEDLPYSPWMGAVPRFPDLACRRVILALIWLGIATSQQTVTPLVFYVSGYLPSHILLTFL